MSSLSYTQVSALRAAGHPAVPRAAHRQECDVREQDAGGAEDAPDQDHQHLLSGHAPARLLHRHQVSCLSITSLTVARGTVHRLNL